VNCILNGPQVIGPKISDLIESVFERLQLGADSWFHVIPCRLNRDAMTLNIDLGAVSFVGKAHLNSIMSTLDGDGDVMDGKTQDAFNEDVTDYLKGYYAAREVFAIARTENCTFKRSQERARRMALLGLNLISLMVHPLHAARFSVLDHQTDDNGRLAWLYWRPGKRVEGGIGGRQPGALIDSVELLEALDNPGNSLVITAFRQLTTLFADALKSYPVVERLVEALEWYGEGLREDRPASSIIKMVTSLERLVLTSSHKIYKGNSRNRQSNQIGIKEMLIARVDALCCSAYAGSDSIDVKGLVGKAYGIRSDLIHGNVSANRNDLPRIRIEVAETVGFALRGALAYWRGPDFIAQDVSTDMLDKMFEELVERLKNNRTNKYRQA
jgi:hypothetical protein